MAQVTVKTDIPQTVNYQSCTVQAGTTTTLASDQNATVTNAGTEYNAVLNFGIPRGKSAYEQAVEGGYQGTEEEFEQAIASDIATVADNISDINAVGQSITEVNAVADNLTDVSTVADNVSDINTVAGISSDVSQVAGISAAVSTVSAHDSEVTLVSDNMASVMATASNIGDIQTVAGIASDVSTVAGIASDVSAVEDIKTDISAVVANSSNINAVANNESNINAVNANKTNIDAVAGNSTNINAVAGNETNINAVNANKTNIDTVAGNNTNVTTVATNISSVNTAATNMAAIVAAPTAAQNAATSATNAQTWAEGTDTAVTAIGGEHSSKGWANVAKQYAESIGAALKYKGSVATYSALPSTGQEVGDMWNVLDTGKNYAWTGTEWDDLSGVVDLSAYRTAANQDIIDGNLSTAITNHTGNTNNPHSVTASQVGLGNVDNTSDLNKPISIATQTALDGKQATISSSNMLSSDLVDDTNHTNKFVTASEKTTWSGKQDALVSGTNIKTVNSTSLLGSGDITIDSLPSQTGQSGKFLTTDGTDASWTNLPTEIEWATYGTTTYQQVADWDAANKIVLVKYSNDIFRLSKLLGGAAYFSNSGGATYYSITVQAVTNIWAYSTISLQSRIPAGTSGQVLTYTGTAGSVGSATLPTTMTGADGTNAGTSGLVPAPAATDNTKYLKGDGTWAAADALPSQTGQSGKFLTTDGTDASWSNIPADINKVDITSSWGFPSSTYVDLTLPASGSTYTVPDDGYLYFAKKTNGNGQYVGINGPRISTQCVAYGSPMIPRCYLAVKKGDVCTIEYSAGDSAYTFRFVYAQKTN